MKNNKSDVTFEFELPGFELEDVKVSFEGNSIVINASKKREETEEEENFKRFEKSERSFYYESTLPENLNVGAAKVNLNDGVLNIIIPKIK